MNSSPVGNHSYTVRRSVDYIVRVQLLKSSPMVEMSRRKPKIGMFFYHSSSLVRLSIYYSYLQ